MIDKGDDQTLHGSVLEQFDQPMGQGNAVGAAGDGGDADPMAEMMPSQNFADGVGDSHRSGCQECKERRSIHPDRTAFTWVAFSCGRGSRRLSPAGVEEGLLGGDLRDVGDDLGDSGVTLSSTLAESMVRLHSERVVQEETVSSRRHSRCHSSSGRPRCRSTAPTLVSFCSVANFANAVSRPSLSLQKTA